MRATFDEVRILYLAKMLRILAANLSSGFVLMYIFKLGYGWTGVFAYLVVIYILKAVSVYFGGFFVAKYGPKHGMLLSNLTYIPTLIFTAMAEQFGLVAIILGLIFQAISISVYNFSQYVGFSKVKNVKHSGRQIGVMYIVEKFASALAPLAGGFFAANFGAPSMMLVSAVLFGVSAIPLLATKEATTPNIKLDFKTFPVKNHWRNFLAQGVGGVYGVSGHLWTLAAPIFVFANFNAYGVIGVLASLSAVFSMIAAIIYGKIVDGKSGQKLLRATVVSKAIVAVLRSIFLENPVFIGLSNPVEGIVGVGFQMSNSKGAFSDADKSGRRIEYFAIFEICFMIGGLITAFIAAGLFAFFGAKNGMRSFLMFSSVAMLLILVSKYPVYNSKK